MKIILFLKILKKLKNYLIECLKVYRYYKINNKKISFKKHFLLLLIIRRIKFIDFLKNLIKMSVKNQYLML